MHQQPEHAQGRSAIPLNGERAPETPNGTDPDYWHCLIDEVEAGKFLGLDRRTMQKMRQTGNGPVYVALSSRCLRYRRLDLHRWAEARLRKSTSDPGPEASQ